MLYIHLTAVSQEILKNLVLAGVKAVICDARAYPDAVLDTPSFFFPSSSSAKEGDTDETTATPTKKMKYASTGHACKAAVEELNPLLGDCPVLDKTVQDLLGADDTTLSEYETVICSQVGRKDASALAAKCKGKFYLVDCFGWNGAAVMDLGSEPHLYRIEKKGKGVSEVQKVDKRVPLEQIWKVPLSQQIGKARQDRKHPPLVWLQYRCVLEYHARHGHWPTADKASEFQSTVQELLQKEAPKLVQQEKESDRVVTDQMLQMWASTATAQMTPVCAVLGGVMGNEVIKVISGKGEPANNVLVFNGMEGHCRNLWIAPEGE